MSGNAALKLDQRWEESRELNPSEFEVAFDFAAVGSSPVATLQHQLHQAALRGFFDKKPSPWRAHRRTPIVIGVAVAAVVLVAATFSLLAG